MSDIPRIMVLDREIFIGDYYDVLDGKTLAEVAEHFDAIQKEYEREVFEGNHIRYENKCGDIYIVVKRLENDKEYAKRVARLKREEDKRKQDEKAKKTRAADREYKNFLKLKKKFEGT